MADPKENESTKDRGNESADRSDSQKKPLIMDRPLIEPIYMQSEPSEPIDLGTVSATFANPENACSGEASVSMQFIPEERLYFACRANQTDVMQVFSEMGDPKKGSGELILNDRGVRFDAIRVSANTQSDRCGGIITFVPSYSLIMATQPTDTLVEAIFHVFNFPDFNGPEDYCIVQGVEPYLGWIRCGRVVLKADGWTITIAATHKTAESIKSLDAQGGFCITHMGRIVRDDSSHFSSMQLEDVLSCLRSFFSLALGRWAGVALPIGFDKDGKRAFEEWGMPKAASGAWKGSLSWFDAQHAGLLSDLFPAYVARWKDDLWGPALKASLYWYIAANDRGTGIGVDAGLILAQAALEQLAWTYCVQDRKMVSKKAFEPRGLSTADRLRLLATAMNIPTDLPASLRALHAKRGSRWDDGPDAITAIRNALVHPNKKSEFAEGSYYEAWNLSLWLLDLVFLRLLGHEGEYANRVSQRGFGRFETVPWVSLSSRAGKS